MANKTIYDIEYAADVSIATVSRVFNNTGKVKAKTREKILRIADEMGYHPQVFAQGLARKKNTGIMLFVPVVSNYFFMEILAAVQDTLAGRKFELNVMFITPNGDLLTQIEHQLKRRWAAGYLFVSLHLDSPEWGSLGRFSVPISLVDDFSPHFDSVSVDNEKGGYLATRYFLDKGYRRIAKLSAEPDSIPVGERLRGYRFALDERGIPFDKSLVQYGDDMEKDGFTERSGYQAMKKILSLSLRPEACVCVSDINAIGALKAMEEANIQIPLIGYDNLTLSEYIGLSTIHQPLYDMGRKATENLIKRIENPKLPPSKTTCQPELIIRSSSETEARWAAN